MPNELKCFHTSTINEEHQELIFSKKRSEAIQHSEAIAWTEYINVRATRKPEYDQYAARGYVPKKVLLRDGWWFECFGYNERGHRCCKVLTIEGDPLIVDEHVYCDQACFERLKLELLNKIDLIETGKNPFYAFAPLNDNTLVLLREIGVKEDEINEQMDDKGEMIDITNFAWTYTPAVYCTGKNWLDHAPEEGKS